MFPATEAIKLIGFQPLKCSYIGINYLLPIELVSFIRRRMDRCALKCFIFIVPTMWIAFYRIGIGFTAD